MTIIQAVVNPLVVFAQPQKAYNLHMHVFIYKIISIEYFSAGFNAF